MDDNNYTTWMTTKIKYGWQQLYNIDDNEDKTWGTTTIQPMWSAKNGKNTCDPAIFFCYNINQRWGKVKLNRSSPKKIPKSPKSTRWQSTCRPRGATPRAARRSPSPRRTPPRGRPPTMCSWPRGITNYWRCPVSSLDRHGIDSWNVSSGTLCSGGPPTPCSMVAVELVDFKCVFPWTASSRARIFLVSWVRLSFCWAQHLRREQRILSAPPYCTSLVPYSIIVSFLQQHDHRLHHQHHRLHHHHHHRHIPSDGQLSPVARSGGAFNWPFVATANWLKSLKDCISTIIIIIFFFE